MIIRPGPWRVNLFVPVVTKYVTFIRKTAGVRDLQANYASPIIQTSPIIFGIAGRQGDIPLPLFLRVKINQKRRGFLKNFNFFKKTFIHLQLKTYTNPAIAYDNAAKKYHGDFATLNFK